MINSFTKNKQDATIRKLVCEALFEGSEGFENKCFKSKEELDDMISSKVVYPQGFKWIFVSDIVEQNGDELADIGLEKTDGLYVSLAYHIDLMSPNGITFAVSYEKDGEVVSEPYENLGALVKAYNENEELRALIGDLPEFEQREALEDAVKYVVEEVNKHLTDGE